MNRRWTFVGLTLLGVGLSSHAGAQSWGELGGMLNQACSVGTGGTTGQGNLPFGGTNKLMWLCNLRNIYGFVNNQLVNGDWEQFATDVIGKYATDLAGYAGDRAGFDALNSYTERLNNMLVEDYANFRRSLFGAMSETLYQQSLGKLDDNTGLPDFSAGRIADAATAANPTLNAAQTAGRIGQTTDAYSGMLQAYRAKKLAEQNAEAIAANVGPAISTATNIIGGVGQDGIADTFNKEAETALSQREVSTIQLQAFTEYMKQDAVFNTAILNQLSEIAKQGVMTNTQLLAQRDSLQGQQQGRINALKEEMELAAQENLEAAIHTGKTYTRVYANTHHLMTDNEVPNFAEVAP